MNKLKIVALTGIMCVSFAVGLISMPTASVAEPGTTGDPVVTESYMKQELAKLQKEINELKNGASSGGSNSGSSNSGSNSGGSSSNGSSSASIGTGVVTANSLNVRSGAGTSYSVVGSLSKNTQVTVIEKSGSWYKIKYGNITGWVSGDYLKVTTSGGSSSSQTLGKGKVTANALNVRSGAGTSYSVVGSLSKNAQVTLLSKSGSWYKISSGNITGWVSADYIQKI